MKNTKHYTWSEPVDAAVFLELFADLERVDGIWIQEIYSCNPEIDAVPVCTIFNLYTNQFRTCHVTESIAGPLLTMLHACKQALMLQDIPFVQGMMGMEEVTSPRWKPNELNRMRHIVLVPLSVLDNLHNTNLVPNETMWQSTETVEYTILEVWNKMQKSYPLKLPESLLCNLRDEYIRVAKEALEDAPQYTKHL